MGDHGGGLKAAFAGSGLRHLYPGYLLPFSLPHTVIKDFSCGTLLIPPSVGLSAKGSPRLCTGPSCPLAPGIGLSSLESQLRKDNDRRQSYWARHRSGIHGVCMCVCGGGRGGILFPAAHIGCLWSPPSP